MHGDCLGQTDAEPAFEASQLLQRGTQKHRVVPVGRRLHTTQWDPVTIGQQGTLGAQFPSIYRGFARFFTTARSLDQAAIDAHLLKVKPDDAVIGFQAQLLELVEDARLDPFVSSATDAGGRTRRVGDALIGGTQHQDLDELVEDDPVGNAWTVTTQRVRVDVFGEQRVELVPQRFNDR